MHVGRKNLIINKFNKLFKKTTFRVIIICFTVLGAGALWQNHMSRTETNKFEPPGQIVNVNNHKMHMYAKGEGVPTVVFTTGSGTPCAYTDYYYIQKELQKTVRTVTYDRSGFGWSDPTSIPRTIDNQVDDLHKLLNLAGEKSPYILVGHSLSSLEVIHFAQLYPKEIAGIVLIDGGNPTFYANYSEMVALTSNSFFGGLRKIGFVRALGTIGIFPPLVGESLRYKLLPEELQQLDKVMFYNMLGNEFNRNALKNTNENAKKVIEKGKLGNIPLRILTAGEDESWKQSQVELKDWSSNSKQEYIKEANHYIHWSNSNIVIDRIKELVDEIKSAV